MGHQSYVLLCSKMASFPPSEGQFSEKSGIFSKVKIKKMLLIKNDGHIGFI